jgi:hypothetical protein
VRADDHEIHLSFVAIRTISRCGVPAVTSESTSDSLQAAAPTTACSWLLDLGFELTEQTRIVKRHGAGYFVHRNQCTTLSTSRCAADCLAIEAA